MKEELGEIFKTLFVPEIEKIRIENSGIRSTLGQMSERLSDMNQRITSLDQRIDGVNKRIDESNNRIASLEKTLNQRIDECNQRIDKCNQRIDETNREIGRLYSVVVRREEQEDIKKEFQTLRHDVDAIKQRLAV